MTSLRPTVSVIIPVYNRGAKVRFTIESVLRQTLRSSWELIVVDDGSTDCTLEFLETTYGHHPSVRIIHQKNQGVAFARNRGLKEAHGEFIAFLDHDDRWLPEKLEAQLGVFEEHPHAGVVYCRWLEVDEAGEALLESEQRTQQLWWKPSSGWVYDWFLAPRNPLVSMSIPLVRARVFKDVGGFDPATVPCDDLDIWLRVARRYQFIYLPQDLVLYSHHPAQQTSEAAKRPGKATRAVRRVFRKQGLQLLRRPHLLWYMAGFRFFLRSAPLYQEAKQAVSRNDQRRAWTLIGRLLVKEPWALLTPQWMVLIFRVLTGAANRF